MCAVFNSNFAAYIVCRRYQQCEFLGFVWTSGVARGQGATQLMVLSCVDVC